MKALARVALVFVFLSVPVALFQGFVLSQLWRWFVLDAFPGVPALGVIDATGFAVIASLAVYSPKILESVEFENEESEYLTRLVTAEVIATLSFWLIGWVLTVLR